MWGAGRVRVKFPPSKEVHDFHVWHLARAQLISVACAIDVRAHYVRSAEFGGEDTDSPTGSSRRSGQPVRSPLVQDAGPPFGNPVDQRTEIVERTTAATTRPAYALVGMRHRADPLKSNHAAPL